jgi:hypothetical protein
MHARACRYFDLFSNQISGSFPSVVSGLSSLSYVGCVLCVCLCMGGVRCAYVVYCVHLLLCVRALHVW